MEKNLFAEQIVVRENSASVVIKKLVCISLCAALLVIAANIPVLASFLPILCAGLVLITIALVRSFNLEYEYTLAEGEFSVDVIRGKSSRARKIALSLSRVTEFVPAADARAEELAKSASDRFDFSSSPKASGRVSLIADSDSGRIFLIIEPNEKMYSHIVSSLPASVRMSVKDNA